MVDVTSVPPFEITSTGCVNPSEAAIRVGVKADLNAAFGGNLNQDDRTPQGQLATSTTAIIGDTNSNLLALVNGVDPAYATGRMQDAIGRIYFLERLPALPTVVTARCYGKTTTVIPIGAKARATDGNIYLCTEAGTIPVGGYIDLPFACTVDGPIACPTNTLNVVYQAIAGWDSVTNLAAGVIGRNVESRAAFEDRRRASVAVNAVGSLPAIRGAVLAVADVLDAYVTDNATAGTVVKRGVTLGAYELYVAAVGGTDEDVAAAIWRKKAPGVPYYDGNTTETVTDTSGYSIPYPTYTVKFERPAEVPVYFKVTLTNSTAVPTDYAAQVKAVITAAFSGADGGSRATIGATLYASRYYAGVASLGTWVNIDEILIGLTDPAADSSVEIDMDQVPVIDDAQIDVSLV